MTEPAVAAQGAPFPVELAERRQWLVWRFITKPGQKKLSKMPYYVDGGLREGTQGDERDRARLVSYTEALAASSGFDGLGFAFLPGDGLIGIDLDAVLEPERQQSIVAACGTYAETSPSGTGVHIIGFGETETFKSNDVGIEVFCGRQFFTMTGQRVGVVDEVAPIRTDVIDKLRRTVEQAKEAKRQARESEKGGAGAGPATPAAPAGSTPAAAATRYCMSALESAVQRMRAASEGGRNDLLNGEVYGLAQLVHTGGISEATIRAALRDAAIGAGLPPGEVDATIRSAMRAGLESPRPIPEREPPRRPAPAPALPPHDPETGELLDAPPAANDNRPARFDLSAVDWWSPFPDVNGKGKPLGTIENVAEACRRLRVTVRYNVISKEIEILIPGEGFSIDNAANASLAWLTSACQRFGVPTGQLGDFLCYMADRNPYNPVAQWITSRPWDGRSRLQALMSTIVADGEADDMRVLDLKEAMIRRWMISAVAAAFQPTGVSAHGVLVLQGDQYVGKTAWFKSLVPKDLGVIQDGLMLRPDDRDSVKQAVSYWLVELGELDATFRKSDIAQLKAFLTRDKDTLRRAYAKLESHYARRTVFFASVNPRQFLHDPTGNRRYWTISAVEIQHQHGLDMQQVWAEVYEAHFLKGEGWYLAPEEMAALNEHNRDHEVLDPIRERLLTRYDWKAEPVAWRWMTATDVMSEIGFDKPTRADVTSCGQLLAELNGGRTKKSNGKRITFVPPRINQGA